MSKLKDLIKSKGNVSSVKQIKDILMLIADEIDSLKGSGIEEILKDAEDGVLKDESIKKVKKIKQSKKS